MREHYCIYAALFEGTGLPEEEVFNIISDNHAGYWCGSNMTLRDAYYHMNIYRNNYVGRPYPNGKGFYPFKNFRIIYAG